MVKAIKNRTRRMKGRGSDESGARRGEGEGDGEGKGDDSLKFEGGEFASEFSKLDAKAGQHGYTKIAIENPHTTVAFAVCVLLFMTPLAIYGLAGKPDGVFVNELMLSMMSASMSASGLAWFLLQGDADNIYVKGFIGVAGISFIAWCYFIYNISQKADCTEGMDEEEEDEEDDEEEKKIN